MNAKPVDYIDVSEVRATQPATRTIANEVRNVIRRFYDQQFTARDVFITLQNMEQYRGRTALYATVRKAVHKMGQTGILTIISAGRRGGSGNATVYMYVPSK